MKQIYSIIILYLIFLGLSFIPYNSNLSVVPVPNDNNIRILTFNTHYGINQEGKYNIEGFVKLIEDVKPQVIGFQEVTVNMPGNGFANMFEELRIQLNKLGYPYSYMSSGGSELLRNVLFSQYKIIDVKTINLEPKLVYQRTLIIAKLQINNHQTNVLITHLTHVSSGFEGSNPSRIHQVNMIIDEINKLSSKNNTILMGDFNSQPNYTEIKLIKNVLIDAWNYTNPNLNGFTSPGDKPDIRIDYIFLSPDITTSKCVVPHNTASDHLPVYCDISLS